MLPTELLLEIISLAVHSARNRPGVLRLSQVSRRFRVTVLSMSRLFTEADWNVWHVSLVELWCRRARPHLLNIYLNHATIRSLAAGATPKRKTLLESYSSRWGALSIHFCSFGLRDLSITNGITRLLECPAPSLHTLQLSRFAPGDAATDSLLLDGCTPRFRVLHLRRVWPLLSTPCASVVDLTCVCENSVDWLRCLNVVMSCQSLQRLTLDFRNYQGHGVSSVSVPIIQTVLKSLLHLELREVRGVNVAEIRGFLGLFDIPNLDSLGLQPCASVIEPWADLYESLVRSQAFEMFNSFETPCTGR